MAKKNKIQWTSDNTPEAEREIVITRIINAPRALVYDVWTDPKHVVHWWGPKGFTNTIHEMDVRPGGVWRLTMHGPDGVDYPNKIVFKEVVKPERLVWSHGSDEDPDQFQSTVIFTAKGRKTELYMRMVFRSKEQRDLLVEKYGAIEGNRQTIDRLEAYLAEM
jgi:uncharacterized protein YndB with AHSA1/START domain